jgi:integrase
MKVTAYIRQKDVSKNDLSSRASVYFRVRDKGLDIKSASELQINPNYWSPERQGYKNRVALVDDEVRNSFDTQVKEISNLIAQNYYIGATSAWLKRLIFAYHHPNAFSTESDATPCKSLTEWAGRYLRSKRFDRHQECNIKCLVTKIERFEMYRREAGDDPDFTMNISSMTSDDLREFESYLLNEHEVCGSGNPRSINTIRTNMTLLRTICNWVRKQGVTTNDPFCWYEMPKSLYGTPFYLTLQERDQVLECDLSGEPILAEYRDMFVFQCMVGCRHGDLVSFTPKNIIDGVLEYIPHKTIHKSGRTVRVPLIPKAKSIVDAHCHGDDVPIFPLRCNHKFNTAIRQILAIAGVDRVVTVIDPRTRKEVKMPICDVATSHLARRTFIGNLYRQVKDPNLVASMSGHANGSAAFARYRVIDDDMKKSIVQLIQ